jgi:SHAQKYF class myb-like DNA-binding protein
MAQPNARPEARGLWSTSEHERFLEAIALYPQGPWQLITAHVGTRSAKQVQTHAQKYQHKLMRHQRGLRKWKTRSKRPEHRVDTTTADQLMNTKGWITQRKNGFSQGADGGSDEDASDISEDSDCNDILLDGIEPVPFGFPGDGESVDHLLLEALAAILSWPADCEAVSV